MVSAQIPGILTYWRKKLDGNRNFIYSNDVAIIGPGGSSEGSKASTANADNQLFVPAIQEIFQVNETLEVDFDSVATQTTDVSDGFTLIPTTTRTGLKYLKLSDFTNPTPVDAVHTAGVEAQLWGGHLVKEPFKFGGGFIFQSIEDNA